MNTRIIRSTFFLFPVFVCLVALLIISTRNTVPLFAEEKDSPATHPKSFEDLMQSMQKNMDSVMRNPFFSDPSLNNLRGFDAFEKGLDGRFREMLKNLDLENTFKGFGNPGSSIHADAHSSVREENDKIIATIDLPGHDKKSIDLKIKDNALVISSERKSQSTSEKDNKIYRNEISYGKFSRIIELPKKVLADKITATFDNGVLTVTAPIDLTSPPTDAGHKIEIQ